MSLLQTTGVFVGDTTKQWPVPASAHLLTFRGRNGDEEALAARYHGAIASTEQQARPKRCQETSHETMGWIVPPKGKKIHAIPHTAGVHLLSSYLVPFCLNACNVRLKAN